MRNSLAALILVCAGLTACEDVDVGVPCQMTQTMDSGSSTSAAQINPQAMDCRSRLCLLYGGLTESRPLCTKICDGDSDCPDETETCPEGFTCIPATQTTNLACCKMCVCNRFVAEGGGTVSTYCEQNPNDNCPKL